MVADNITQPHTTPTSLVIFGITGDLAKRKLLPAIYHLFKDGFMDEHTRIIGTSRHHIELDNFMKNLELCVLETDNVCDPAVVELFRSKLELLQLDPEDAGAYDQLRKHLDDIEDSEGMCMNRLFYLSIPPSVYRPIVKRLGEHGLNGSCQHNKAASRLLVEKPFGRDIHTAQELIRETTEAFTEEQIFRIDHYLAKETAQNILTFRAYNPMFVDLWNNRHIRSIDITASEKIGIEGRAAFYEGLGALRDLVQSHLLQLLALVTIDLPEDLGDSEQLHDARKLLLEATHARTDTAVRGQYKGYRQEVHNEHSATETYVSLQVEIRNERWQGTPITITTGKALAKKTTEVSLTFSHDGSTQQPNVLTFRIQPDEGIGIRLQVKEPGFEHRIHAAAMDFRYHETFGPGHHTPDAYERVLVDAIRGDRTLFASSDEVLASWRIIQPVLDQWQSSSDDLVSYAEDSGGPKR